MPSGPEVPERVPETKGLPDSEHQGQRQPDSLREVLGCPHPLKGPGPRPGVGGGGSRKRSFPIPGSPHPLSHLPRGINHVYKLWKNWDILQKNNKKYT